MNKRKPLRLKTYDYSSHGFYFVTLCAQDRTKIFGYLLNGHMVMNDWGRIVSKCWGEISDHFSRVKLDQFVVMPDHVHGILSISNVGAGSPRPVSGNAKGEETSPLRSITLGQIVGYFKYQSTKQINAIRNTVGQRLWQRNYFERVIRHENELNKMREYILNNPKGEETSPLHSTLTINH